MDANPITHADERIILAWARRCRPIGQDDIAQDIRMAWLDALPRYAPARSSRRTYLNSVARKVVYCAWRSAYRQCRAAHRTVSGYDEVMVDDDADAIIHHLPDTTHRRRLTLAYGGAVAVSTEQAIPRAVWDALAPHEQALLRTVAEARSLRQAAERLGCPWTSFKRRLEKVRRKIVTSCGPLCVRRQIEE